MSYTYNYLGLVNRVLEDFNEVPLDSTTFANAMGFQAAVKDYINDAINDILAWQDTEWPFLWTEKTFTTTIGTLLYTKDSTLISADWNSFEILKVGLPTTLTQTGGLVTATVASGHQLIAGDVATVTGATQSAYNGKFTVTITSPTVYTYNIPNVGTVSPATGTILTYPYYNNAKLTLKDFQEYRRDCRDLDNNARAAGNYSPPCFVIRKPDNNFIISPPADRVYTIQYEGFVIPSGLSAYTDVPLIPDFFKQVIIDRVGTYALAFRDNDTQVARVDQKFEDNCHRMRRILIMQGDFLTFKE